MGGMTTPALMHAVLALLLLCLAASVTLLVWIFVTPGEQLIAAMFGGFSTSVCAITLWRVLRDA